MLSKRSGARERT